MLHFFQHKINRTISRGRLHVSFSAAANGTFWWGSMCARYSSPSFLWKRIRSYASLYFSPHVSHLVNCIISSFLCSKLFLNQAVVFLQGSDLRSQSCNSISTFPTRGPKSSPVCPTEPEDKSIHWWINGPSSKVNCTTAAIAVVTCHIHVLYTCCSVPKNCHPNC